MRVAIFSRFPRRSDRPRGGVETVTLALVRALEVMDDVDLHVVTLERDRRMSDVSTFGRTTIHRLPGSRWPQMMDILIGPGRRRLIRYLTALAPDVIHFHETYGLGIGQLAAPHVLTVHGFDYKNIPAEQGALPWLRAPIWKRIESWGLAQQRHIISITPYVRQLIAPLTQAKIYSIDNPVDPSFFEIERREKSGRVLFAGWITHRKNARGLIRAFARVVDQSPHATLHIAGEESDPTYAQVVRSEIQERGLSDRVKLLGGISPADIRRELSQACVFALPSRQENAPMVIAEALAAGVPVVSSNLCGMPFMIEEGKTGFLVDPEDPEMLATRLIRLLEDDELRARMGGAARSCAIARFHPRNVARKTKNVYDEIVSDRKNREQGATHFRSIFAVPTEGAAGKGS